MPPTATPARSPRLRPPADLGRAAPARSRIPVWLVIGLPAVVAAVVAGLELGTRSLWLDEAASVAIASQHGSHFWHAVAHDGGNMLAFYALLHILIGWFGAGEAVIRMPSVLAHVGTAALTAGVGLRLFARPRVALGAGLLAAVSLPLVYWGQDARGYALMVTFSAASVLAYAVLLQSDRARTRRLAGTAYVLTTLIALYMGFYAALVILAELAVLPLFRARARVVIAGLAAVGAGCIPLVVLALERGSGQLFWVSRPTWSIVGKTGLTLISSGMPPIFHLTVLDLIATGVTLLVGIAVVVIAGLAVRRAGRAAVPRLGWLALSWLLVPVIVMLAASLAGEPVELQRAVILVIPAVAILLGAGLGSRRLPAAIGWSGLTLLLAMRILVLAPTYGTQPEDWQAATAHVASVGRPGACLFFYPEDGRMPFDYYLRGRPAAAGLVPAYPPVPWSVVRPYVENYSLPSAAGLAGIVRRCPQLWVIASHQGHRPGPPESVRDLQRYHGLLAGLRASYPHVHRSKFGYAAVIHLTLFSR